VKCFFNVISIGQPKTDYHIGYHQPSVESWINLNQTHVTEFSGLLKHLCNPLCKHKTVIGLKPFIFFDEKLAQGSERLTFMQFNYRKMLNSFVHSDVFTRFQRAYIEFQTDFRRHRVNSK